MQQLELVSHHLCPYVQRVAIALHEKGVPFTRRVVDLADKPAWFRAISPRGKVPLLKVDGAVLFESAVICEYLEDAIRPRRHPNDPLQRAHHRAWIEFGSAMLTDIAGFYNAAGEAAFAERRAALRPKLERLEDAVGNGPFFSGDRFSLVDAAFAPVFRYFDLFERVGKFGFLVDLHRVSAWRTALLARPSVAQAIDHDYGPRLEHFMRRRDSWLASLMREAAR